MVEAVLTPEQEGIIAKVEKLFALAKNNPNENEAESAAAKAMDLLAAYNLDMASVGKPQGSNRKDTKLKGGLYTWQRNVWNAVAELNFCKYWFIRDLAKGQAYEHRILGRVENVASTCVMADYLQDAIERLAVEYGKENYPGQSRFIKSLIIYREGLAGRISERLRELRRERLNEERRKQEEARTRHSHGGFALVLADVIQTEDDLNNDYLMGWEPGTTAKNRAESEARRAKAMEQYYAEVEKQQKYWDEHPEEFARHKAEQQRQYEKWEKENARKAERRKTAVTEKKPSRAEQRMNDPNYWRGYQKGNEVGLDRQIDNTETKRIK